MSNCFEIIGKYQQYAWGKIGESSAVANFLQSAQKIKQIEDKPYAELWFGIHSNGPSTLEDGSLLVVEDGLPYLFKILSVNTALSIQAHPDKDLAAVLHEKDPEHYADSNHKPEMAVALTEFEVLCSFREHQDLINQIDSCPELKLIIEESFDQFKQDESNIKKMWRKLMETPTEIYQKSITDLLQRLDTKENLTELEKLAQRLNSQYPGDIGIFAIFFLNHITLQPGQAVYLGANEPHAYLSGDCVECMANSDNVVRAGLTPKFKDVDTLCEMLTYKLGLPKIYQVEKNITKYIGEAPEFQIWRYELENGAKNVTTYKDSSILLVMDGEGNLTEDNGKEHKLQKGTSLFIKSNSELTILSQSSNLMIFIATVGDK